MTKISDENRARLLASKAKYEREAAEEEAARLADVQAMKIAGFGAGREWAENTATYEELSSLINMDVKQSYMLPTDGGLFAVAKGHDHKAFQDGAREVFEEVFVELKGEK
jgi:hypothetical protein